MPKTISIQLPNNYTIEMNFNTNDYQIYEITRNSKHDTTSELFQLKFLHYVTMIKFNEFNSWESENHTRL